MSIIGWFIWRLTVQAKDVRLRGSRVDEVHSWMVRIWLELDSWRVVQKFLVGSSNRLIGWNLLLAERRVFEWFLELTQSRHLRDRILLFIYVQNSNKSHSVSGFKLIQISVIRPNRINLPSPRSQRRKFEWQKGKISSTRGAVRAHLFYCDCLLYVWTKITF